MEKLKIFNKNFDKNVKSLINLEKIKNLKLNFSNVFSKLKNIKNTFNKKKLKIIFMGTPPIAVPFLEKLYRDENVLAVFTAPDKPMGRHMQLKESDVKIKAKELGIKIFQPKSLKDDEVKKIIENLTPDLILIVAYGYIIPENIINIPKFNAINIHFSLLPKYRGAAPINWAIINGETETGVSSFFITKNLDDGDIISQKSIKLENDNSLILADKLVKLGLNVLEDTINILKSRNIVRFKQDNTLATFAPKLKKSDGLVNWKLTSHEVYNKMKGLSIWPGSYSYIDTGDKLKMIKLYDPILQYIEESGNLPGEILDISRERGILIKCGFGALWIQKVQLEGQKIISGYDFMLGRKLNKGDVLGA